MWVQSLVKGTYLGFGFDQEAANHVSLSRGCFSFSLPLSLKSINISWRIKKKKDMNSYKPKTHIFLNICFKYLFFRCSLLFPCCGLGKNHLNLLSYFHYCQMGIIVISTRFVLLSKHGAVTVGRRGFNSASVKTELLWPYQDAG